jgi:dipeptidyl aminopeptidase/acylaminoacyl peptidase
LFSEILKKIETGDFGKLNPDRLYATGISSGGYNTSRLVLTFPGKFKAIAIQSASYATCVGPVCVIPNTLPANPPPTLLLHGGRDMTVPLFTALWFEDVLQTNGVEVKTLINPSVGHGWLPEAPQAVLDWFESH